MMDFEEFKSLSKKYDVVPIYHKINGIMDEFSVYLKLIGESKGALLESAGNIKHLAEVSYIGLNPQRILKIENDCFYINEKKVKQKDIFSILSKIEYTCPVLEGYRFVGGYIGYISYEFGKHFVKFPRENVNAPLSIPELYLMFFEDCVAINKKSKETLILHLANIKDDERSLKEIYLDGKKRIKEITDSLNCMTQQKIEDERNITVVEKSFTKKGFEKAVVECKERIKQGDVYQANLSVCLKSEGTANPLKLYDTLRKINPSPFMGYINFGDLQMISSSPERLFLKNDRIIETRPIAGTIERGKTEKEDDILAKRFIEDKKECAEHVMLVDLERNDIGRICEYGSVDVTEFMRIERYSHVQHLVSNVCGILKKDIKIMDILEALFPGGTITGAPKKSAMMIIDELEPVGRGTFTGSMGYISVNGNVDFNIIIRTIIKKQNQFLTQAGAGIVMDSDPHREYIECIQKARALLEATKSSRIINKRTSSILPQFSWQMPKSSKRFKDKKILMIDNYDSFTYNLVQYFGILGTEINVIKNDEKIDDDFTHMVISPGPGKPKDAGISKNMIEKYYDSKPILGVCLGHQCIGEIFGGEVNLAPYPVHGKTSIIRHNQKDIFENITSPLNIMRYHSLVVDSLPKELEVTATTEDNLIMGIKHKKYDLFGVQFHPESILTDKGLKIIENFLEIGYD